MILRIVLVGIEGALNLGVIARTCKNFEVDELYIVCPKADLDEAYRYAAQGKDFLEKAMITETLDEALYGSDIVVATSAKGFSIGDVLRQAISIDEFIESIKRFRGRLALLFGRESTGLTREEIEKSDFLVTIPASSDYPVLNVSQAVAIFLWELWRIRRREYRNIAPPASREEVDALLKLFNDVSEKVLSTHDKVKRFMYIWRHVLYRAYLRKYEVRLLTYWIRRVSSKLNKG